MDPGGPHESSGGRDRDPGAHARALTATADRGGRIGSSRGGGCRPTQKSQPSGTSSAVSSSPFRIRAIASVRALTARKTVGQHAWELSDRSLHNVMAQVDQSRPRRPGQAQDRRTPLDTLLATLLARPDEQLIELVIGQSRGILHSDGPPRGLMEFVSQTPIIPPNPQNNLK